MKELYVIEDGIKGFLVDELSAMRLPETIQHECPHCKLPVLYPLTVRQSDVQAFRDLFECAEQVMDDLGITQKLIARIRAQCVIAIANRAAGEGKG
jgi:hypothetical protein